MGQDGICEICLFLELFQVEIWHGQTKGGHQGPKSVIVTRGLYSLMLLMGQLEARMVKWFVPETRSQLEAEPEFEPRMSQEHLWRGGPCGARQNQQATHSIWSLPAPPRQYPSPRSYLLPPLDEAMGDGTVLCEDPEE